MYKPKLRWLSCDCDAEFYTEGRFHSEECPNDYSTMAQEITIHMRLYAGQGEFHLGGARVYHCDYDSMTYPRQSVENVSPMVRDFAERAAFDITVPEEHQDAVAMMITDIRHYCDLYKLDFWAALASSRTPYAQECGEGFV